MDQHLFVRHLTTIERVIGRVARRYRLPPSERDDFAGAARLHLLKDGCRVLREYGGRSSMSTYLTAVLGRLLLEFRNQQRGRWRPSATARRMGPLAVLLERLVHRDRYTPHEAVQSLSSTGRPGHSERELWELWRTLPMRMPSGPSVPIFVLDPDPLEDDEDVRALQRSLLRAVADLPDEDRLLLSMHFGRGRPLVDIARAWGVSRATIMRRFARILRRCRDAASDGGVASERIAELVARGKVSLLAACWREPFRRRD